MRTTTSARPILSYTAVIIVFLAVFSAAAFAHEANFVLSKTSASLCPGGTIQISATITNTGASTQTYTLSAAGASAAWATIAPIGLTVAPNQAGTSYVYITPDYTAQPGTHNIEIKATHPGGEEKQTVALEVLSCFGVSLKADKTIAEGCVADSASFDVNVTNNGKYSDIYTLTSTAGTLTQNTVTVDSGKSVIVKLTTTIGSTNESTMTVTASSSSGSKATLDLKTKGTSCYAAKLSPQVVSKTVCSGDSANYTVDIENTGNRTDEFDLSVSQGTVSPTKVTLNSGEKKTVTISASPKELGTVKIYLTAKSPRQILSTDVTADVGFCRGVAVIGSPASLNVCGGTIGRFQILVKNTGRTKEKFALSSTLGTVSQSAVEIEAGAIKELTIDIPTKFDDLGRKSFTVTVKSTGDSPVIDTTTGEVNVEACYAADFVADKPSAALCPSDVAAFELSVKNTGKVEDTFKFTTEPKDAEVTPAEIKVKANETGKATLKISKVGEYNVTAASAFVKQTTKVSVVAKGSDLCYGFTVTPRGSDLVESKEKALFTLVAKNTGEKAATYTVSAQAPEFASIDPRGFTLNASQEKEIFVYIAPPVGTKDGVYKAKVAVTSDKGAALNKTVALAFGNVSKSDLEAVKAELAAELKAAAVTPTTQAANATNVTTAPTTTAPSFRERLAGIFGNAAVIALIVGLVVLIILFAAVRAHKLDLSKFRLKKAEIKEDKVEKPRPRKKRKAQSKPETTEATEETGEIAE